MIINVLNNINFIVQHTEMIVIVGNSGFGKSTLLHLLGGLDSPNSGEIIFNGLSFNNMSLNKKAQLRNRQLGFIYQFHHLFLDFTALENVAMPLLISGTNKKLAQEKAMELLISVGLEK